MKYRPKIGPGDFDTKTRQVTRFLAEGHAVAVVVLLRGRERTTPELGLQLLDNVATVVDGIGVVKERRVSADNSELQIILAPVSPYAP
jgi:translation initiation factor IF-3